MTADENGSHSASAAARILRTSPDSHKPGLPGGLRQAYQPNQGRTPLESLPRDREDFASG